MNLSVHDFLLKDAIQFVVFPNGIVYDREMDNYRTEEVSPAFKLISCLSGNNGEEKEKPGSNFASGSHLAGCKGTLSNNEPFHSIAFPNATKNIFPVANIQLPDNFKNDLEKIENFYDLYLKDLFPILKQ